jgi:hypothetical protein
MSRLGQKSPQWTGEELKTLAAIKASGSTIKTCMGLLPGRTYLSIKQAMARLPGGRKKRGRASWVGEAIRMALEKTPGLTNLQLSRHIGATRNGIQYALKSEHGKSIRISGWVRSGTLWVAQYSVGTGPDAIKPAPRTKAENIVAERAARVRRRAANRPFDALISQIGSVP